MNITEVIKKARPNIKDNSVKAYVSNLKKVAERLGINDIESLDFLTDMKKVINVLPVKTHTKKNYLASIIVVLGSTPKYEESVKKYRAYLDIIMGEYHTSQEKQEKNKKQKELWVSFDRLLKATRENINDIKRNHFIKKTSLTDKQFNKLQDTLIMALYMTQPPRRLEYADMKVISRKQYLKLDDLREKRYNWLVVSTNRKKVFVFNQYKTSKTYGSQTIAVGRDVNYMLNVWLKFNKTGWLLLNKKAMKMSSNSLTRHLMRITKSEVHRSLSVSMLRHIYISEVVLKDSPKLNEMKNVAKSMGHSIKQQQLYRKD